MKHKRPVKKVEKGYVSTDTRWLTDRGFNQSCEQWEAYLKDFLPCEEELHEIVKSVGNGWDMDYPEMRLGKSATIAESIANRLKGGAK